jgi:uncharacterized membrane protein YesL
METFILTLPGLIVLGLVGMFSHFLKKNITGETTTEIFDYFRDHFKSTLLALIVTLVSVIGYKMALATGQAADIVVVFLLGFGFDSTLNKWDKNSP